MAYQYIVSTGSTSQGPWTQFNIVSSPSTSDIITGLAAGTAYYFQIVTLDTVTGVRSAPVVVGPYTTTAGVTESPNGTSVTSASQTITSSQTPGQAAPSGGPYDTWTITGVGGSVVHNGTTDTNTSAILMLYYINHYVYQQASNGNSFGTPGWWQWTGPGTGFNGWTDAQDPRPAAPTISITAINQQTLNTAFSISGLLQNYLTAPTLQYQDNTGAFQALPAGATVTTNTFSFTHPAVTTSTTGMTVSVRDANNTATVATSNSFAVLAAGQVALQGITLAGSTSGATFPQNASVGTVVGAIVVQTVGGSFTGSLALSGTDQARFTISGSNLVVNQANLTGSYSITITASMSGAQGSPLVKSFSISAAAPSNVTVNLAATNGKTVNSWIWGFNIGGVAYGYGNNNSMDVMLDSTSQASMAKIPAASIRSNCQQTAPICYQIFANGTGNPNWTILDRWINNHSGFYNDSTGRVVWGIGENADDTFQSPQTWAAWAPLIAQHFKDAGQEVFWWEIGNEPGNQGQYINYFNAIADALHAFNSTYKCGGPAANWIGGQFSMHDFANSVGTKLGFLTFHQYNDSLLDNSIYQTMVGWDFSAARNALAGTPVPNIPIIFSEYNLTDFAVQNTSLIAPIGLGLQMVNAYKNDPLFIMAAIWDYVGVNWSPYACIGNSSNDRVTIDPMGWYLGAAGKKMGGAEVSVTNNTGRSNLQTLACKTANTWAIQIINYNIGQPSVSVTLGLAGGASAGQLTVWQLDGASLSGRTSTVSAGSPITCASESITIVTGSYA